jgi:hypothetical protein
MKIYYSFLTQSRTKRIVFKDFEPFSEGTIYENNEENYE